MLGVKMRHSDSCGRCAVPRLAAVTAAAWCLAGCTVMPAEPARFELDAVKIDRVERAARNNGVSVYWINPPVIRVEPNAESQPALRR